MVPTWKNWQYKNTSLLILSLVLFFYFIEDPTIQQSLKAIGNLGYIGSFITGIMFVSTFTVVPASAILFETATILNPYWVAVCAGLGAVIGDYILFRYLQDRVFAELRPLFEKHGQSILGLVFSTPFFAWMIPIIGAIIIASPFPDEVGIGLMGLSKIKRWQFILITFLLNSVGIFVVISIASAVRK